MPTNAYTGSALDDYLNPFGSFRGGPTRDITGRMTWFNPRPWSYTDPNTGIDWTDDQAKARREGAHASGLPLETPGFATAGQGGLGGWHEVTLPGGRKFITQKTDIGPPGVVDLNAALASQAYPGGPRSVPGGNITARYLGPTLPSGLAPGEVTDRASGSPGGLPELQYALPGGTDVPPGREYDGTAPANATAGGGRKMPNSLLDMFRPEGGYYGPGGQQDPNQGFGGALAARQNSLIGLGLGLMNQRPGSNAALSGFQTGAAADASAAQNAQSLAERRAEHAQAQKNWEKTFARGGETEFQKMQADINKYKGTPHEQAVLDYYQSKTEPPTIAWQEDASGNKLPYVVNPRSKTAPVTPAPGFAQQGPANPYAVGGKMTENEGKTALFADRAATAHDAITKFENLNQQGVPGAVGGAIEQGLWPGIANVLVSGERGQSMNAKRSFVNALLRRESGAAINAGEFASYDKEYFPQLGDTQEQINDKRKHRAEVIAGLAREAGKAYRPNYSFDEQGNIKRSGGPTYAGKGGGETAAEGGGAPPPPLAIQALRQNSGKAMRDQFDAKYGEGAAMRALTGR